MPEYVKIVFPLEVDEDGYPPVSSEALHARRVARGFVLENTPFFATGVALGDCVQGTPIAGVDNALVFTKVVAPSNSKAVSIIVMDDTSKQSVLQELKQRNCYIEYGAFGEDDELQMLAVAISEDNYASAVSYLEQQLALGRLSYAELAT